MALILAIQPDERQAAILSGVVMNQLRAELVLVDSKDAALARIRKQVPDLILLAAELGRPDDEDFASRLRKIKNAEHLRTLSMPPLGSPEGDEEGSGGGLLRAFKRKRADTRRRGRDPKQFARELHSCLKRAEWLKAERRSAAVALATLAPAVEPTPAVEPVAPTAPGEPVVPAAVATPAARQQPADRASAIAGAVVTLDAIETRAIASKRATDTTAAGPRGDLEAIIGSLRVPPLVAGISYPRGCRIRRIHLARAPRIRVTWRPTPEPPPVGMGARLEAAL